jgi:hypothetical protein
MNFNNIFEDSVPSTGQMAHHYKIFSNTVFTKIERASTERQITHLLQHHLG